MGSPRAGDFYKTTNKRHLLKQTSGGKKRKDLSIGRSWEHRNTPKRFSFSNVRSVFPPARHGTFGLTHPSDEEPTGSVWQVWGGYWTKLLFMDQSVQPPITFSRRVNFALHHRPVVGKNTPMCETNLVPKPVIAQWERLYRQQKPWVLFSTPGTTATCAGFKPVSLAAGRLLQNLSVWGWQDWWSQFQDQAAGLPPRSSSHRLIQKLLD